MLKVKNQTLIKIIFLVAAMFSPHAFAEYAVIVNPNNTSKLTEKDIARIFLGKVRQFPNGKSVEAIDHKRGSKAREQFSEVMLNKSEHEMKAYWSVLIFTGRGRPPKQKQDDQEILKLVSESDELISYVDVESVNESVKVVYRFK